MKNTLAIALFLIIGYGCSTDDEAEYPKDLIGKWYLYDVVVNPASGMAYVQKVDDSYPKEWLKLKKNGSAFYLPPGKTETVTSKWKYTRIDDENQYPMFDIEFEVYEKPTKWRGFFYPNNDTLVFDYPISRRFVKR